MQLVVGPSDYTAIVASALYYNPQAGSAEAPKVVLRRVGRGVWQKAWGNVATAAESSVPEIYAEWVVL